MRNILVIGVSLILLTAGTALAVKPDSPGGGGKVDIEAALETETQARIDGDLSLQSQIDDINSDITSLPLLYAVTQTSVLPPGWGTNMIKDCYPGDTLVGGMCKYDIDPIENNSTVIYDGPYIGADHESWQCYLLNKTGNDEADYGYNTITMITSSICMNNSQ